MNPAEIYRKVALLSAEQWRDVLLASVHEREWNGIAMPTFPKSELQSMFVGSSNEHALLEAYNFYVKVHEQLARHSVTLAASSRILDFGCGWGRYMRYFMRDLPWDRIYGVDPWHLAIDVCRQTGVYGQSIKIDLRPPLVFKPETFDLIFAYSVFSHLSQAAGLAWIEEFAKVVKPGGLLMLTTQGRTFIDYCASLRGRAPDSDWHASLQRSFADPDRAYADYDAGKFLYAANGGGPELPAEDYGEAAIPKGYIEANWTRYFELLEFIDDRNYMPQALIVMRRK